MGDRIIRCWIEMDLYEGEHFTEASDNAHAETLATVSFYDTVRKLCDENEVWDWIQTKIVEAIGDN